MEKLILQPLTPHDERIVRDTVHRKLRLEEVDLVIEWSKEIMEQRPLTEKEQALHDLLWAQHCALYVDRVTYQLLEQRKEDRERTASSNTPDGSTPE